MWGWVWLYFILQVGGIWIVIVGVVELLGGVKFKNNVLSCDGMCDYGKGSGGDGCKKAKIVEIRGCGASFWVL